MALFDTPETLPLSLLFQLKMPMVVDPYQRDYAWTFTKGKDEDSNDGEVADFIYDLERLIHEVDESNATSPYFFGLIVSAKQSNSGWETPTKHEIVDGQQRLTTFVLLASTMIAVSKEIQDEARGAGLTAVERRCASFQDLVLDRYVRRELKSTTGGDPKDFPAVTVTKPDNRFFQDLVNGRPVPTAARDSQRDMLRAHKEIKAAVESWLPSGTADERDLALSRIRDIVLDRTEVIFITAETTVNAYRLFSVANNRGRPLEQADLLRAYLLQLMATAGDDVLAERVVKAWNDLDKRPPKKTNAALRAYYGSVIGIRAPKGDVFDAFAEDVFGHSSNDTLSRTQARALRTKVDEVVAAADLFDELSTGVWPYTSHKAAVKNWDRDLLKRIVIGLKGVRTLPLLLAAATEWASDERKFSTLVSFIEKAEVRFLISGAHASSVADRYFETAAKVRAGATPVETVDFLRASVNELADGVAFRQGLDGLNYTRNRIRIRHLLTMLDDHWADYDKKVRLGHRITVKPDRSRTWNLDALDLDHIYPVSGTAAEFDKTKNHLGNLTLLLDKHNRDEAKALLPTRKRKIEIYTTNGIETTKLLGRDIKNSGWNATRAEARRVALVEMAEFIYRV